MSTISRAVELMGHFTQKSPEIGLSEMCRLSGRDKATCFRHLQALESVGLLEQNPANRKYRIGTAVLRWAVQREAAMPRRQILQAVLPQLAEATGETAHCSILERGQLWALMHHESNRHSTRVVMGNQILPFHATASGMAVLAFSDPAFIAAQTRALPQFTAETVTDPATITTTLAQIRQQGIAVSAQGFEAGVHSLAAPVFDDSGTVAGAVAIAAIAGRMTPVLQTQARTELIRAAQTITASWGGTLPPALVAAWTAAPQPPEPIEVSA